MITFSPSDGMIIYGGGEDERCTNMCLGRIMRALCSVHVFEEVAQDTYANSYTSAALVNNEPLRAYILLLYVSLSLSISFTDALPAA